MNKCGNCKVLRYCSPTCQRAHWTAHKQLCKWTTPTSSNEPHNNGLGFSGCFFYDMDSPKGKAMDIIFTAFDEPNPEQKLHLARRALTFYPAADAHNLIGDYYRTQTGDMQRALESFDTAIRCALEEYPGARTAQLMFWGVTENREQALQLLRLNPSDNQGMRDLLFIWLPAVDDAAVEPLLIRYADCGGTSHAWGHALHACNSFSQGRLSAASRDAVLAAAMSENPAVKQMLLDRRFIDISEIPKYASLGGEIDAKVYAKDGCWAWRAVPGALEWLSSA
ncbi:hypothetical protein HDV00_012202 [Rhizophlyctis rosea]|nr:hypothetical protein HDV00_012202 [Rhizophlyctis rosea]